MGKEVNKSNCTKKYITRTRQHMKGSELDKKILAGMDGRTVQLKKKT